MDPIADRWLREALLEPVLEAVSPAIIVLAGSADEALARWLLTTTAARLSLVECAIDAAALHTTFGDRVVAHGGSTQRLLELRSADLVVAEGLAVAAVLEVLDRRGPQAAPVVLVRGPRPAVADDHALHVPAYGGVTLLVEPGRAHDRLLEALRAPAFWAQVTARLDAERAQAAQERAALVDEVAAAQDAAAVARREAETAERTQRARWDAVRDDVDELRRQLTAAQAAEAQLATRWSTEQRELATRLETATAQATASAQERDAAQHALTEAGARYAALESQLEAARAAQAQATDDLQRAQAAAAGAADATQAAHERRRRETAELTRLVESLEGALQDAGLERDRAAQELTRAQEALGAAATTTTAQRDDIARTELELARTRAALEAATARADALAAQVSRLARAGAQPVA